MKWVSKVTCTRGGEEVRGLGMRHGTVREIEFWGDVCDFFLLPSSDLFIRAKEAQRCREGLFSTCRSVHVGMGYLRW